MNSGYVVGNGEKHYCTEDCLHTEISPEEWDEMTIDEDNSPNYWTEWEDMDEYRYNPKTRTHESD